MTEATSRVPPALRRNAGGESTRAKRLNASLQGSAARSCTNTSTRYIADTAGMSWPPAIVAGQNFGQCGNLGPHLAAGHLRQDRWITLTGDQPRSTSPALRPWSDSRRPQTA
jgi:hypothetical protein